MSYSNVNRECVIIGTNDVLELIGTTVIHQGELFTVQRHLSLIYTDVF